MIDLVTCLPVAQIQSWMALSFSFSNEALHWSILGHACHFEKNNEQQLFAASYVQPTNLFCWHRQNGKLSSDWRWARFFARQLSSPGLLAHECGLGNRPRPYTMLRNHLWSRSSVVIFYSKWIVNGFDYHQRIRTGLVHGLHILPPSYFSRSQGKNSHVYTLLWNHFLASHL